MEGKLIKVVDKGYYNLENKEGSLIATSYIFKDKDYNSLSKLSLKNCEAIVNGYDLDDLARDCETNPTYAHEQGFIKGFQKALEILGDKKFSEEDIKKAYYIGKISNGKHQAGMQTEAVNKLISSLQQTEWGVEIVTEKFFKVEGNNGITIYAEAMEELDEKNNYKLDADGCLILKRK
jgi:hypothetical protein